MNIILIAPPAAGKGTQAEMLEKDYNLYHLSTGDVLRSVSNSDTPLGKKVKELIDNGNLVSDELIMELIKDKINSLNNTNGIIFDGIPRTINQAKMLEEIINIDYVIYLDIEKDIAMKRSIGRRTCPKCNKIYNIYFDEINDNKCYNCNVELLKREDDTEEKFNHRFDTYLNSTLPVINYYKEQNKLVEIKNIGTKYDINNKIKSVINKG